MADKKNASGGKPEAGRGAMTGKSVYNPRAETVAMLDRAYEIVSSVDYAVSARWLFYRLLQEGFYSKKDDYKNSFGKTFSQARHAFYGKWRPDTLTDETRQVIARGDGYNTPTDWLDALRRGLQCHLDKWHGQDYYVELWFEARAMANQFEHYTENITLRPLGGQPSIPYKWDTAKGLEEAAEAYGAPIIILYFGDLDAAGGTISDVVERDVRNWCEADFVFVRCGLTLDQVKQWGVPENPEKPGEYQWEALPDEGARAIITESVSPYLRLDAFAQTERVELKATTWLRSAMGELVERYEVTQ